MLLSGLWLPSQTNKPKSTNVYGGVLTCGICCPNKVPLDIICLSI